MKSMIPYIKPMRYAAKRYKCHQYFTRQPFNVVSGFIDVFSKPKDVIFDPFCGSGTTPIEAFLNGRIGVGIDLSPHAVRIANGVLNLSYKLNWGLLDKVWQQCLNEAEKFAYAKNFDPVEREGFLYPLDLPCNFGNGPKSTRKMYDKENLYFLQQMHLCLGRYQHGADEVDALHYDVLMFMFSCAIERCSVLAANSETSTTTTFGKYENRQDKYKSKRKPPRVVLETAFGRCYNAHKEMCMYEHLVYHPDETKSTVTGIMQGDAACVKLNNESVDYIYTDPPYGGRIHYLQLSLLYQAWFDDKVEEIKDKELCIDNGYTGRERFLELMDKCIGEMHRVLKPNKHCTFVFSMDNFYVYRKLFESFKKHGFTLVDLHQQETIHQTLKKALNTYSVLGDYQWLTFKKCPPKKIGNTKTLSNGELDFLCEASKLIRENKGADIDMIFNNYLRLCIKNTDKLYGMSEVCEKNKGWKLGKFLKEHFVQHEGSKTWQLKNQIVNQTLQDWKDRKRGQLLYE